MGKKRSQWGRSREEEEQRRYNVCVCVCVYVCDHYTSCFMVLGNPEQSWQVVQLRNYRKLYHCARVGFKPHCSSACSNFPLLSLSLRKVFSFHRGFPFTQSGVTPFDSLAGVT